MNRLSRPTALKIAAVLSFILGIIGFIFALPMLSLGESGLDLAHDAPPYFVILSGFIFAIMRLAGAYGVWTNRRWGIVVTILANALDGIFALPGIFFAPTVELWLAATLGVIVSIVIVVLCLWRDRKPALA